MLFNLFGMFSLCNSVTDYLGVDAYAPLFRHVQAVLEGEKSFEEALSSIRVTDYSEFSFLVYWQLFRISLSLNEAAANPDPAELRDAPFVIDQAVALRPLYEKASETLKNGEYITGLFALSILVALFLSSYPSDIVETIDLSTLPKAYLPLKRGLLSMSLGEKHASTGGELGDTAAASALAQGPETQDLEDTVTRPESLVAEDVDRPGEN